MSEDFQQLALRLTASIRQDYAVIRDIVLHDETVRQRNRVAGVARATVAEKARRFVRAGMRGLIDQRPGPKESRRAYPVAVAGYILYLK